MKEPVSILKKSEQPLRTESEKVKQKRDTPSHDGLRSVDKPSITSKEKEQQKLANANMGNGCSKGQATQIMGQENASMIAPDQDTHVEMEEQSNQLGSTDNDDLSLPPPTRWSHLSSGPYFKGKEFDFSEWDSIESI
jgi:hypothetical protein